MVGKCNYLAERLDYWLADPKKMREEARKRFGNVLRVDELSDKDVADEMAWFDLYADYFGKKGGVECGK